MLIQFSTIINSQNKVYCSYKVRNAESPLLLDIKGIMHDHQLKYTTGISTKNVCLFFDSKKSIYTQNPFCEVENNCRNSISTTL